MESLKLAQADTMSAVLNYYSIYSAATGACSSPNIMNCVEFGFDRSRGFGSARGQFWPIAID
jgi:hypothetical protein